MRRFQQMVPALAAVLAITAAPSAGAAQSLHGSHASVEFMYASARSSALDFLRTPAEVQQAALNGRFVLLAFSDDVALQGVSYPYLLPATEKFLEMLAAETHRQCGERLIVTSAARPTTRMPRNGSPMSVHPTGMAVDVRKPQAGCLNWFRSRLLQLETAGVVDATEEFHPRHFHIAVLPGHGEIRVASRGDVTLPAAPRAQDTAPAAATNAVSAVSSSPVTEHGTESYTVRRGDTLWGIARRTDTTVNEIRSLNGLRGSRLTPGQKLKIPTG